MTPASSAPIASVHIIGAGLLGASAGLALKDRGVHVTLEDASPSALSLAVDYGAGVPRDPSSPEPDVVVVATPPDVTATVVIDALERFTSSLVIDVASVKGPIVSTCRALRLTPRGMCPRTRWRVESVEVPYQPEVISSPLVPGWCVREDRRLSRSSPV